MSHINFNGKILHDNTPIVIGNNRGLRYGDGIFETIKLKNGKLFFGDEHFARLWKGMQVLQMDIPKHFSPEKLEAQILSLAQKNKHQDLARIRLTVFRGEGGMFDAVNHQPNYLIESWALPAETGELNSNGLELEIYSDAKKSMDILSNLKHNNYLPNILAAQFAKKNKCNDVVMLNCLGNICETTIANIFLIKDEITYTPGLNQGCVAGTIRKFLIEELKKNNFDCVEKEISIEELLLADEVFLTNSIKEIRWVKRVGEKSYGFEKIARIYKLINQSLSLKLY